MAKSRSVCVPWERGQMQDKPLVLWVGFRFNWQRFQICTIRNDSCTRSSVFMNVSSVYAGSNIANQSGHCDRWLAVSYMRIMWVWNRFVRVEARARVQAAAILHADGIRSKRYTRPGQNCMPKCKLYCLAMNRETILRRS